MVAISAILCMLVPPADEADKLAATLRLLIASAVLILAGVLVYLWGARRALAARASQGANP